MTLAYNWGTKKANRVIMSLPLNKKIFIVDDDPFFVALLQQHLQNLGFEQISTFLDGHEFLNKLTESPDIVLLDYSMSSINGLEILKKIKRFDPNIFTILISAQEDMQVAVDALKYGAFDYIIKGENTLELTQSVLNKINVVLDMVQQRRGSSWKKLLGILNIL